jgi:hypothetical protein
MSDRATVAAGASTPSCRSAQTVGDRSVRGAREDRSPVRAGVQSPFATKSFGGTSRPTRLTGLTVSCAAQGSRRAVLVPREEYRQLLLAAYLRRPEWLYFITCRASESASAGPTTTSGLLRSFVADVSD